MGYEGRSGVDRKIRKSTEKIKEVQSIDQDEKKEKTGR